MPGQAELSEALVIHPREVLVKIAPWGSSVNFRQEHRHHPLYHSTRHFTTNPMVGSLTLVGPTVHELRDGPDLSGLHDGSPVSRYED